MVKRATPPKKTKAKEPEPFFRPFAKLKAEKKKPVAPAPAASTTGRTGASAVRAPDPLPEPRSRPARPVSAGVTGVTGVHGLPGVHGVRDDAPPRPVDPDTFAIYMAGVVELADDRALRIPMNANRLEKVSKELLAPKVDPDAEARARMRSLVTDGLRFETSDDGERLDGRRLDVDPRALRRLRKGTYTIDGKLDLHGLNTEDARRAVEAFVRKRAMEGDVSIMIVHGRGSHSPRGNAVLRGEIAAWLSQGRAARHVQAFATAPDDLGGAGAVLVLLAR